MITDDLITQAYYLANVRSADFEDVTGADLTKGLMYLNKVLGDVSASTRYIPYYSQTNFPSVIAQEKYFVPGLVETSTVTFTLGTIRYSMWKLERNRYFGTFRALDLTGFPFQYLAERTVDGTDIFFYFKPSEIYDVQVTGKFSLQNLEADTVLDGVLDTYYQWFLIYKLAETLCHFFNQPFALEKKAELDRMERNLPGASNVDLTSQKTLTVSPNPSVANWAYITFGPFGPPGY